MKLGKSQNVEPRFKILAKIPTCANLHLGMIRLAQFLRSLSHIEICDPKFRFLTIAYLQIMKLGKSQNF